jgi:hypothetical protein
MAPKPAVYLVMMTLLWQLSGLVKSAVVFFLLAAYQDIFLSVK